MVILEGGNISSLKETNHGHSPIKPWYIRIYLSSIIMEKIYLSLMTLAKLLCDNVFFPSWRYTKPATRAKIVRLMSYKNNIE